MLVFPRHFQFFWEIWHPLPTVGFCLINFLSGSAPPKSAKRNRMAQGSRKKKFGNASKKNVRAQGGLFFFWTLFWTSFFGVSGRFPKSIFHFFFFHGGRGHLALARNPPWLEWNTRSEVIRAVSRCHIIYQTAVLPRPATYLHGRAPYSHVQACLCSWVGWDGRFFFQFRKQVHNLQQLWPSDDDHPHHTKHLKSTFKMCDVRKCSL